MARTRRAFFCGNWKLNGSIAESLTLATDVRDGVASVRDVDVAVAPSFTALHAVATRLKDGLVMVAAQDCFWEEKGAFTGEVAPSQLADAGCKLVIVGHSERRQLFGELDAAVNLKARAALRAGLTPIICIGETLAERDAGEAFHVVARQLEGGLAELTAKDAERLVIAYEPVWAIGTGRTASPQQAQEMHEFIRGKLAERFGEIAQRLRILYGGSVKPDNASALLNQPEIDGALVGGASLDPHSFTKIVKY